MKDFLGQELAEGDYVSGLYPENETPALFQIIGFTPKKCKLEPIDQYDKNVLKFSQDLLKLENRDAMLQLINQPPKDALGQELKIGDTVFGSGGDYIEPVVFVITGFAPTKAIVTKVYGERYSHGGSRLTKDLIKVDSKLITMHCLTKERN